MDSNSFQLDPAELAQYIKDEREGVNLLPLELPDIEEVEDLSDEQWEKEYNELKELFTRVGFVYHDECEGVEAWAIESDDSLKPGKENLRLVVDLYPAHYTVLEFNNGMQDEAGRSYYASHTIGILTTEEVLTLARLLGLSKEVE